MSFPLSHQTKYSINQLLSPNDQAVEARYLEQNEDCKKLLANIAKVSIDHLFVLAFLYM